MTPAILPKNRKYNIKFNFIKIHFNYGKKDKHS